MDELEHRLSEFLGVAHVVSCTNGTAALDLAYLSLGLERASEVVFPAYGFLAAANAALRAGLSPRFADVDAYSWCIDPESVRDNLGSNTSAILSIDTYGSIGPMEELRDLALLRGIRLIEDAAEAFGSTLDSACAGTLADVGTFSFQATKTITCGEGGAMVTQDAEIAERARLFRSHGMGTVKYQHMVPGANYRLTNIQAAIACAQLDRLAEFRVERVRVRERYRENLWFSPGVTLQEDAYGVEQLPWAVALQLDPRVFPQGRGGVMVEMAEAGIEVRPGFGAPSRHDFLKAPPNKIADELSNQVIVLPTYPDLQDSEIDYICATLEVSAGGRTNEI